MEIETNLLDDAIENDIEEDILELPFDETEILEECEADFDYQIMDRGKDYYESGKVIKCSKSGNKYIAKVKGTESKPYDVTIEYTEFGLEYDCTCPCNFPCKHEYAVLLAISNKEYENIKLEYPVKEIKYNLQSVLKEIPAEEIKEYVLSSKGMDNIILEMNSFEEHFRKYLPKQSYCYYYNNLYNALVLQNNYKNIIANYFTRIKQYISHAEFQESFKITKSIIESYNNSNKLNSDDYITDKIAVIGMYLRVIYRKANKALKQEMHKWILDLKNNNYYNNYYLEDSILSIGKI